KQSGDRRPSYYAVSKQGRKSFRNAVYQIGRSLSVNNPEMKEKYNALKERGKHAQQAYIALGNRMIRLAFSMIKNLTLYRTAQPIMFYSSKLIESCGNRMYNVSMKSLFRMKLFNQLKIILFLFTCQARTRSKIFLFILKNRTPLGR